MNSRSGYLLISTLAICTVVFLGGASPVNADTGRSICQYRSILLTAPLNYAVGFYVCVAENSTGQLRASGLFEAPFGRTIQVGARLSLLLKRADGSWLAQEPDVINPTTTFELWTPWRDNLQSNTYCAVLRQDMPAPVGYVAISGASVCGLIGGLLAS